MKPPGTPRARSSPQQPLSHPAAVVDNAIEHSAGHVDGAVHQKADDISTAQWLRLLIVLSTCLLLVLAVAVLVRLLGLIPHTLLLFALGALLAYALEPLVERVRRIGGKVRPRWVGVATVFVALFGLAILGGVLLSDSFVHQIRILSSNHTLYEQHARAAVGNIDEWLSDKGLAVNLSQYFDNPPPEVKSWGQLVAHSVLTYVARFSASVVESILVVLIALYFLIYSQEMRHSVHRHAPDAMRPYVEHWQDDVSRILGGFVRGQLLLALIMGAAAGMACLLLGLQLWLLIGIFVMLAALIPVVGPYIGAIPAVISAALTQHGHFSPAVRVVAVVIVFFIINEFGSKVLYPRLVGAALGLHEIIVLFALLAGFEVGRLAGVLFAAPVLALSLVTVTHLYRLWQGLPPLSLSDTARREGAAATAAGTP